MGHGEGAAVAGLGCETEDPEVREGWQAACATLAPEPRAGLPALVVDAALGASRCEEEVASTSATTVAVIARKLDPVGWALLRHPRVRHLFSRPAFATPGSADLACEVAWMVALAQPQTVRQSALELALAPHAVLHHMMVWPRDRHACLEAFARDLAEMRLRRMPASKAQLALDELLMNALIDAPAAAGHAATAHPVLVSWGGDDRHVGLAVRDAYGLLSPSALANHVLAACARGGTPLPQPRAGAGLGLYFVASAANHLIVAISPHETTEVAALFARDAFALACSVHVAANLRYIA